MKALVVRQPWATLIALGHKTIETRPSPPNGPMRPDGVRGLPGCSLERGERIAIVAGASLGRRYDRIHTHRAAWQALADATSTTWGHIPPVETGAVVCTVTVDDALPIVHEDEPQAEAPCITVGPSAVGVWRSPIDMDSVANQLPLGDFTPGRWGWRLSDPQPPTNRCWRCSKAPSLADVGCLRCDGYGRVPADPIPCKGRQGVFELPADIAEALS